MAKFFKCLKHKTTFVDKARYSLYMSMKMSSFLMKNIIMQIINKLKGRKYLQNTIHGRLFLVNFQRILFMNI